MRPHLGRWRECVLVDSASEILPYLPSRGVGQGGLDWDVVFVSVAGPGVTGPGIPRQNGLDQHAVDLVRMVIILTTGSDVVYATYCSTICDDRKVCKSIINTCKSTRTRSLSREQKDVI